jgi:hypothetical protein
MKSIPIEDKLKFQNAVMTVYKSNIVATVQGTTEIKIKEWDQNCVETEDTWKPTR